MVEMKLGDCRRRRIWICLLSLRPLKIRTPSQSPSTIKCTSRPYDQTQLSPSPSCERPTPSSEPFHPLCPIGLPQPKMSQVIGKVQPPKLPPTQPTQLITAIDPPRLRPPLAPRRSRLRLPPPRPPRLPHSNNSNGKTQTHLRSLNRLR